MRERVLAIVNLIAQYVLGAEDSPINEQELIAELISVGYEADEINDAFSWMETIALRPANEAAPDPLLHNITYRTYSDPEQQMLTLEARGFLTRLRTMGLLDDASHEEIVERALRGAEDPISEPEIKLVAILTLLSRSNSLWLREIDCFLDNDWTRIYH